MMKIACYPGSFDPFTNGHIDIVMRSLKLFDKLYIIVAENSTKSGHYLFTTDERIQMIKEVFKDEKRIEVIKGDGLTAYQAKKLNCLAIIRGLRMVSDYEYEVQYSSINQYLAKDVDMIFLMSRKEFSFISSSRVKEIYAYDGDVSALVPEAVYLAMIKKKENRNEK